MAEPNSAVGAAQIHEAVRAAFGLSGEAYTLAQLRYDLRKLKAHGLLQREGRTYCYRLAEKGTKVSAMFILFHQRIWALWQTRCFNIGHSQHPSRPSRSKQPTTKADAAIQKLIDLLAA